MQLWSAYDAAAPNGTYQLSGSDVIFGQGPLLSPTVFNFFTPGYAPPGEIGDRGLVAPEMQLANEHLNTSVTNFFYTQTLIRNSSTTAGSNIVMINISGETAVASNPYALVALIADKLLGGNISPILAAEARAAVLRLTATKPAKRAVEAL